MVQKPFTTFRIAIGVTMFVISGGFTDSPLQAPQPYFPIRAIRSTTVTEISAFYFPIKIMNRVYNESLQIPNSQDYKALYKEVTQLFKSVFGCSRCDTSNTYMGVLNMTFRNGSVIAISTIAFSTKFINEYVVKNLFLRTVAANPPKVLILNTKYTSDVATPVPAPLPGATTTPLPRTTHHYSLHTSHLTTHNTKFHSTIRSTPRPTNSPTHSTSHTVHHTITVSKVLTSTLSRKSTSSTTSHPSSRTTKKISGSTTVSSKHTNPTKYTTSPTSSHVSHGNGGSSTMSLNNTSNKATSHPLSYTTQKTECSSTASSKSTTNNTTRFPSSHTANNLNRSTTALSEKTTDSTDHTHSIPSSQVTNRINISTTSPSKNTTDFVKISTTPSYHINDRVNGSTTTPSKNITHSMNIRTSLPPSHANISTTASLKNSTYSTKVTIGPQSSNTIHRKTTPFYTSLDNTNVSTSHSTSGLPKATISVMWPTRGSTMSRSDTTSSPLGTAVPPYSNTTQARHSSSHASTLPKMTINTTHSTLMTDHIRVPNTTEPHKGSSMASSSYEGVPGWAIALLVLVSVILLLLIIFFILALWRWCCHQEETGPTNVIGDQNPYEKLNREPSAPEFQSKDPNGKIYPEEFEKPKKNRAGMYVVNP